MPSEVAEAAKFLDEKVPGWYRLIDLDKLDMQDGNFCVLGQIAKRKRWKKPRGRYVMNWYERALDHFWPDGSRPELGNAFGASQWRRPMWIRAIRARRRREARS